MPINLVILYFFLLSHNFAWAQAKDKKAKPTVPKQVDELRENVSDIESLILTKCLKLYTTFKNSREKIAVEGLSVSIILSDKEKFSFLKVTEKNLSDFELKNLTMDNVFVESLPLDKIPTYINDSGQELYSIVDGCYIADGNDQINYNIYYYLKMGSDKLPKSIEFVGPIKN